MDKSEKNKQECFLNPAQCAKRRGIAHSTILRAIKLGKIPAIPVGDRFVLTEEDCDSYVIETPQESGRRGGNTRWAGHEKPEEEKSKRPRGRPRKNKPEHADTESGSE